MREASRCCEKTHEQQTLSPQIFGRGLSQSATLHVLYTAFVFNPSRDALFQCVTSPCPKTYFFGDRVPWNLSIGALGLDDLFSRTIANCIAEYACLFGSALDKWWKHLQFWKRWCAERMSSGSREIYSPALLFSNVNLHRYYYHVVVKFQFDIWWFASWKELVFSALAFTNFATISLVCLWPFTCCPLKSLTSSKIAS